MFVFISYFYCFCRPQVQSNFEVGQWKGYDENFTVVDFQTLNKKLILLNFYSPICKPCIDELPALNLLKQRIKNKNDVVLYLALVPKLEANGINLESSNENKSLTLPSIHAQIKERFELDKKKYNIKIPMLMMYQDFKIGKGELISATPETLFLKTTPLRLDYNFVGAITNLKKEREILNDSRFNFISSKIEEY